MDRISVYRLPRGGAAVWTFDTPAGTVLINGFFEPVVLVYGSVTGSSTAQAIAEIRAYVYGNATGGTMVQAAPFIRGEAYGSVQGGSTAQAAPVLQVNVHGVAAGSCTVQAVVPTGTDVFGSAAGSSTAAARVWIIYPDRVLSIAALDSEIRLQFNGVSIISDAVIYADSVIREVFSGISVTKLLHTADSEIRTTFTAKTKINELL